MLETLAPPGARRFATAGGVRRIDEEPGHVRCTTLRSWHPCDYGKTRPRCAPRLGTSSALLGCRYTDASPMADIPLESFYEVVLTRVTGPDGQEQEVVFRRGGPVDVLGFQALCAKVGAWCVRGGQVCGRTSLKNAVNWQMEGIGGCS